MRFDRPVLLIADECHRLGAPAASRILGRPYNWTLGLSATPERGGDLGFEQVLEPKLGPVVFKYGYKEAVRDGIIARFSLLRVKVQFTATEQVEYDQLSERVKKLLDGLKSEYPQLRCSPARFWQIMGDLRNRHRSDQRFEMLQAAAASRRDIVHRAAAKFEVVRHIAEVLPRERKVLCFHERIEAADDLMRLLGSAGCTVTVYHSQLPEAVRAGNLARFDRGGAQWLVACRSLDEGLDIPAVDTVVIVAGTKAPRQIIQRLGRALRRKGDEREATVVIVEVAGVDDANLEQEGLEELCEAASTVEILSPAELGPRLRRSPTGLPTEAPAHREASRLSQTLATATDSHKSVALPANKDLRALRPTGRLGTFVRGVFHALGFRGSWTGSAGTKSYYDRDSSPD